MKLAVIGGGGVRSPFLSKSIVSNAGSIGITHVTFMDIDEEKLNIFGKISQQVAHRINSEINFEITTDLVEAVTDADLVITTIRSGGDSSRMFDERIALDMGILGQETTGAGGFAMALRSIPVLLDVCEKIRTYSNKDVQVFNFTNPSGLVTQALRDEGYDFVYGVCDAPSGFEKQMIRELKTTPEHFEMTCFGLNHLSWFRDMTVDGEPVYEKLLNHSPMYKDTELRYFDKDIIELIGHKDFPNEYLYFYYYRDQAVDSIISSNITRGQTIYEINKRMIAELKALNIEENEEEAFEIFIRHYYEREDQYFAIESGTHREETKDIPDLQTFISEPDDGGYAGVALSFIKAYVSGEPVKMVLSVPNNGSLDFLQDNDVVEISCYINKGSLETVKIDGYDDFQKTLISTIKYFERKTVEAIKLRSKDAAIKALMIHPQINSYPIAKKLLDAYLEEYKDYVGEWH